MTAKLERASTAVLMQARKDKTINESALTVTCQTLSEAGDAFDGSRLVSRELIGHALLLFMGLLAEAEHAREETKKDQLLDVAWDIAERLRKVLVE